MPTSPTFTFRLFSGSYCIFCYNFIISLILIAGCIVNTFISWELLIADNDVRRQSAFILVIRRFCDALQCIRCRLWKCFFIKHCLFQMRLHRLTLLLRTSGGPLQICCSVIEILFLILLLNFPECEITKLFFRPPLPVLSIINFN